MDWVPLAPSRRAPAPVRYAVLGTPDTVPAPLAPGAEVFAGLDELAAHEAGSRRLSSRGLEGAGIEGTVLDRTGDGGGGRRPRRPPLSPSGTSTGCCGGRNAAPPTTGSPTHAWSSSRRTRSTTSTRPPRVRPPREPGAAPGARGLRGLGLPAHRADREPRTVHARGHRRSARLSWARIPAAAATGEAQLENQVGQRHHPNSPPPRKPRAARRTPRPPSAPGPILITGGTGGRRPPRPAPRRTARSAQPRPDQQARTGGPPGAADLRAQLTAAGARTEVVACDVSRTASVAEVLAAMPPEQPLTAVIHCAGVLDERRRRGADRGPPGRGLAPKVRGAWHLARTDRATSASPAFVVCSPRSRASWARPDRPTTRRPTRSSTASPKLATPRDSRPAPCAGACGPGTQRDDRRHRRGGTSYACDGRACCRCRRAEGLALFDAAITRDEPVLVPALLDLPAPRPAAGRPAGPRRSCAGCSAHPRTPPPTRRPPGPPTPDSRSGSGRCRPARRRPCCSTPYGRRPPSSSATPAADGSAPPPPSRNWASTRSRRSTCATGWRRRPAAPCPPPSSSTTRTRGALAQFLNTGGTQGSGAEAPGTAPRSPADHLAAEIEGLGARIEDAFLDLADEGKAALSTLLGEVQGRVRSMVGEGSLVALVDRISSASAGRTPLAPGQRARLERGDDQRQQRRGSRLPQADPRSSSSRPASA